MDGKIDGQTDWTDGQTDWSMAIVIDGWPLLQPKYEVWTGQLIDCSTDRPNNWPTYWLIDLMTDRLTAQLTSWLTNELTNQTINWLTDSQIYCPIDQPTDS